MHSSAYFNLGNGNVSKLLQISIGITKIGVDFGTLGKISSISRVKLEYQIATNINIHITFLLSQYYRCILLL